MKYSFAFLAALAAVQASPFPRPQGVTANISPQAAAPSGCTGAYSGTFGIVVQNVTAAPPVQGKGAAASSGAVSQISDVRSCYLRTTCDC